MLFRFYIIRNVQKNNVNYSLVNLFYSTDEETAARPTAGQDTRYVYVLSMRSTTATVAMFNNYPFLVIFEDAKAVCDSATILQFGN